jgi:hypothetical protein
MPCQSTQIKDTPTQPSAMINNTLHTFLSPPSPSEWDVVLTAALLRIQDLWNVTLLQSEWFPVILQHAGTGPVTYVTCHSTWNLKLPPCPIPTCTKHFTEAHKVYTLPVITGQTTVPPRVLQHEKNVICHNYTVSRLWL